MEIEQPDTMDALDALIAHAERQTKALETLRAIAVATAVVLAIAVAIWLLVLIGEANPYLGPDS